MSEESLPSQPRSVAKKYCMNFTVLYKHFSVHAIFQVVVYQRGDIIYAWFL